MFRPAKSDQPERMDSGECSEKELEGVLTFLRMTNRHFGGNKVILNHLRRFSRGWSKGKTFRILDVGCGLADIPIAIAEWAERSGFTVEITASEIIPMIADIARRNTAGRKNIKVLNQNIFEDAFNEPFDYVTASLLLHHILQGQQISALQKMDRIAQKGLILSDLSRSWAGWTAVGALAHLAGNSVVRNDALLSVRRGFTLSELESIAQRAGLSYLRTGCEPFFRISLAGEKP